MVSERWWRGECVDGSYPRLITLVAGHGPCLVPDAICEPCGTLHGRYPRVWAHELSLCASNVRPEGYHTAAPVSTSAVNTLSSASESTKAKQDLSENRSMA